MKYKLIFLVSIIILSADISCITQLEQDEAKKTLAKLPAEINALDKRILELKKELENRPHENHETNKLKKELQSCLSKRRSDLAADLFEADQLSKEPVKPATMESEIGQQVPVTAAQIPEISPEAAVQPPASLITAQAAPVAADMAPISTATSAPAPSIIPAPQSGYTVSAPEISGGALTGYATAVPAKISAANQIAQAPIKAEQVVLPGYTAQTKGQL